MRRAPLDEAALGLERRHVGRRGRAILLIDLRVADLLLRRRAGRQQLLVDAGGHLRDVLVGSCAMRASISARNSGKRRRAAAGRFPALSASSEHGGQRFDAERARHAAEHRHLAEVLAASELRDVLAAPALGGPQANPP